MSDIPEGLVEVVARAIKAANEDGCTDWKAYLPEAIAAIQAHNAWLADQDDRIKAFVEFRGPNPRDAG